MIRGGSSDLNSSNKLRALGAPRTFARVAGVFGATAMSRGCSPLWLSLDLHAIAHGHLRGRHLLALLPQVHASRATLSERRAAAIAVACNPDLRTVTQAFRGRFSGCVEQRLSAVSEGGRGLGAGGNAGDRLLRAFCLQYSVKP